jgi:transposase
MESTAQYWKPVWGQLEGQCELHLAQAHSNRARKGRKDDFRDAERLARRHLSGELILSFVPDPEQRLWRTLTRTKHQLTRDRVRLHNQVEALLEDARIKLSTCVTDLLGVSSRRMMEQLAKGETDPALLAALAEPMLRATPEQLIDALSAAPEMSTQANPQMLQSLSGAASSAARPAPNAPAHQRSSAAIIIRARLPCGSPVAVSSPA